MRKGGRARVPARLSLHSYERETSEDRCFGRADSSAGYRPEVDAELKLSRLQQILFPRPRPTTRAPDAIVLVIKAQRDEITLHEIDRVPGVLQVHRSEPVRAEVRQLGTRHTLAPQIRERHPIYIRAVAVLLGKNVRRIEFVHRCLPDAKPLRLFRVPVRLTRSSARPTHLIERRRQGELQAEPWQRWRQFAMRDTVDIEPQFAFAVESVGVVAREPHVARR